MLAPQIYKWIKFDYVPRAVLLQEVAKKIATEKLVWGIGDI